MLDKCYLQVHSVKNSEFKLKIRIALDDGSGLYCKIASCSARKISGVRSLHGHLLEIFVSKLGK